jgi:hypothetical protein
MPLQSGYRYYDLGTYHCDTPLNGVLPYTVTEAAAGRHNPPLNAQKNPVRLAKIPCSRSSVILL